MKTSSTERDVGGLSKNASQREHIHDAQCGPECQADKMKFQNSAAEKNTSSQQQGRQQQKQSKSSEQAQADYGGSYTRNQDRSSQTPPKDQQKSPQYGENKRDIGQCYTGTEHDKSAGLGKSKDQQKSPQYGENKRDIGQCYTGTETDKPTGLDKSKDQQKSPQYGENKRDIGQCYTGTEHDKSAGLGKSKDQQKSPQYGENKRDIGQCYTGTEADKFDKSKENLEKEFEKKSDDAYAKDTQRGSQRSTAKNQ